MTRAVVLTVLVCGFHAYAQTRDEVLGHYRRGEAAYRDGRILEAIEHYEKAVAGAPSALGENSNDTLNIMNNLAKFYADAGMYGKAETLNKQVLEKRIAVAETEDAFPVAMSYNNLGENYRMMGSFADAETAYQKSLKIKAKLLKPPHSSLVISHNNLGLLNRDRGHLPQSEQEFRKALAMLEDLPGRNAEWKFYKAITTDNLAQTLMHGGRFREAEQMLNEALELFEDARGREHPDLAIVLNNLAWLYQETDRPDRVEAMYLRCLEIQIAKLGREHPNTAMTRNNLGVHYHRTGQLRAALTQFEEAYSIRRSKLPADHPDLATSQNDLGLLQSDLGNSRVAESLLLASLKTARASRGEDHGSTLVILNNLGKHYFSNKEPERGVEFFDRTRKAAHEFAARTLPYLTPREQREFIDMHYQRDLSQALSAARLRPEAAATTAAWAMHGKGVRHAATTEAIRFARESSDARVRGQAEQLRLVRQKLAHLSLPSSPGAIPAEAGELTRLKEQEETLSRRLRDTLGTGYDIAGWAELADVRKAIPADGVLIEFARFSVWDFTTHKSSGKTVYAAWIIPSAEKGDVQFVDLGDAGEIDAAVKTAREAIAGGPKRAKEIGEPKAEQEARQACQSLADKIWKPVASAVASAKTIVLSPDSELWLAPWSALPVDDKRYLAENFITRFAISGRDLVAFSRPKAQAPSLVIADPDFDARSADAAPSIAGRSGRGRLADFEAVFEFAAGGKLTIRLPDGESIGSGTWKQNGATVALETDSSKYTLELDGDALEGERRFKNMPDVPADKVSLKLSGGGTRSTEETSLSRVARLPWTGPEGEMAVLALKKWTGQKPSLLTDTKATESAVKAASRPHSLVLATHGFFLPATGAKIKNADEALTRCGLLLAGCNLRSSLSPGQDDGVLTGLEIVGLDLRGTQLVVLSACESAVGVAATGDGVAGLRQSFQLAGAADVMATLWSIPDRESAILMSRYYALLANGKGSSESLATAQREAIAQRRKDNAAAHPYFWAAYTVTGRD